MAEIEQGIRQGFDLQEQWNPAWKSMPPEVREMMDKQFEIIVPMVADIVNSVASGLDAVKSALAVVAPVVVLLLLSILLVTLFVLWLVIVL